MSDSYIFHRIFFDEMKGLPDESYGRLARAMNEYALNGRENKLDGKEKELLDKFKPLLEVEHEFIR